MLQWLEKISGNCVWQLWRDLLCHRRESWRLVLQGCDDSRRSAPATLCHSKPLTGFPFSQEVPTQSARRALLPPDLRSYSSQLPRIFSRPLYFYFLFGMCIAKLRFLHTVASLHVFGGDLALQRLLIPGFSRSVGALAHSDKTRYPMPAPFPACDPLKMAAFLVSQPCLRLTCAPVHPSS